MKAKITVAIAAIFALAMVACNNTDYKKTKSGLAYKLFSGGSKDSVIKVGNIIKFHFTRKLNDSVLYTSFDKMPSFLPLQNDPGLAYSPLEVFFMAREGDSIVTVEMVDTLLTKPAANQLPPGAKKGDRMVTLIKIIRVFQHDSLARPDFEAEMLKDKPRQEKEMDEMRAKEVDAKKAQLKKELDDLKQSGEYEKQNKEVEAYLTKKNISVQKAPEGTYVQVKQKGTGEPAVDGKFVIVKYTGKLLPSDSVFQSSVYMFQLGAFEVVHGWDDGLKLFNAGGSGTLFIPGYFAYGKETSGPGGKAYQHMLFDVEVLNVSNTREAANEAKRKMDSVAAAK